MKASYDKLWHLLIDKKMKKSELAEKAGVSPQSISKLNNGDNTSVEFLMKLCKVLNCDIGDIVEIEENCQ